MREILIHSNDAIMALDLKGCVLFWNKSAEALFGYKQEEVLGKETPIVPDELKDELSCISERLEKKEKINYRTLRKNNKGKLIQVFITASPVHYNNKMVAISFIIKRLEEVKNLTPVINKKKNYIEKRTFSVIRNSILINLSKGDKSINQLANETSINWKTVENHLTYLIGKGFVREVFGSQYVRIFEITNEGKRYILNNAKRSLKIEDKKIEAKINGRIIEL